MADHQNTSLLAILWLALMALSCSKVEAAILDYKAECSEVTPRAVILRIRWPQSVTPTTTPQIEVSIYKDGFTTGRFVKAAVADAKAIPASGVTMLAAEGPMAAAKLPDALVLRVESLQMVKDGGELEAVLGGLIPGINYYVRVRGISDEVIRIRAPICPADFVDEEAEKPK
jgi:hypothetical protein